MTAEDTRFVAEFIDSLFPVMREGYNFDPSVSNADVNGYRLEAISVPTLIVHTKDDQLASHEASKRADERIPGARFVSLQSGGHLMLGHTKNVRDELACFFAETSPRSFMPGIRRSKPVSTSDQAERPTVVTTASREMSAAVSASRAE